MRVADVCLAVDDAVLLAGLARGLVMTALDDAGPVPDVPVEVLRAATWSAARHGVGGELADPFARRAVPAAQVLGALQAHVRDAAGGEAAVRRLTAL